MKSIALCIVALAALLNAGSQAPAAILYSDNFNTAYAGNLGKSPQWYDAVAVPTGMIVVNSALVGSGTSARQSCMYLNDYARTYDSVSSVDFGAGEMAGMLVRSAWNDPNSWRVIIYYGGPGGNVRWISRQDLYSDLTDTKYFDLN